VDIQYIDRETSNEYLPILCLNPFLTLVRAQVSGTDLIAQKNKYKAVYPGIVPNAKEHIGIGLEIVPAGAPATHEVKQMGYLIDRHVDI
jgi:hypothetical protein